MHEVKLNTIHETRINDKSVHNSIPDEAANNGQSKERLALDIDERMWTEEAETATRVAEIESGDDQQLEANEQHVSAGCATGVHWDVFRRQDVPKLLDYLTNHCKEFVDCVGAEIGSTTHSLYDGKVFLDEQHKRKLKEKFGVEPWSVEQRLGEAVFVPAGCPVQMRNLQSNVQLALDFLFPESVEVAARLAEEVRCLTMDHEAKIQVLEVGKISLYAASSAIKEVQKLVLDPKLGTEIGFEDPNLTAAVVENLEKISSKRKHIACA